MGFPAEDLTGRRFGRLTVLRRYEGPSSDVKWVCRCDCGNETAPFRTALKKMQSRSCGCLAHELSSKRGKGAKRHLTHGGSKTPEYRTWLTMINRCTRPTVERYPQYGGRGICVCKRWRKFENFITDMGPRPTPKHSIERQNNDGNYSPSNCHWATTQEQSYNRQTTRLLDYRGQKITTLQASQVAGIPRNIIFARLYRGWSVARAIETQVGTLSRK